MDERTLRKYWRFFCEVWQLFKKHRNVKSDQDWNDLITDATLMGNRYPGEFSRKVIMEILSELERRNGKNG